MVLSVAQSAVIDDCLTIDSLCWVLAALFHGLPPGPPVQGRLIAVRSLRIDLTPRQISTSPSLEKIWAGSNRRASRGAEPEETEHTDRRDQARGPSRDRITNDDFLPLIERKNGARSAQGQVLVDRMAARHVETLDGGEARFPSGSQGWRLDGMRKD